MPTAYLETAYSRVKLHSERLLVLAPRVKDQPDVLLQDLTLAELEQLVLREDVQITTQALCACLRAGIAVHYWDARGRPVGQALAPTKEASATRLLQYQRASDPETALGFSRAIVAAKIFNQRRVLQRLRASRAEADESNATIAPSPQPSPVRRERETSADAPESSTANMPTDARPLPSPIGRERETTANAPGASGTNLPTDARTLPSPVGRERVPEGRVRETAPDTSDQDRIEQTLIHLAALDQELSRADTLDRIIGFEGASTAAYFQAWATFLPPEFPFERRSARPPLNPVNACISYGASLLYHEMAARLHLAGLDPGLGTLHVTEDGRWSLALDLMEPFRPALVEAMTLRLFTHRMLQADDFEPSHGGIYLAASGRRTFIAEFERRIQREFMSEHAGHRTTLRQQIAAQPLAYKAALRDPAGFRPFRLN